jgi:hypothetical protein
MYTTSYSKKQNVCAVSLCVYYKLQDMLFINKKNIYALVVWTVFSRELRFDKDVSVIKTWQAELFFATDG